MSKSVPLCERSVALHIFSSDQCRTGRVLGRQGPLVYKISQAPLNTSAGAPYYAFTVVQYRMQWCLHKYMQGTRARSISTFGDLSSCILSLVPSMHYNLQSRPYKESYLDEILSKALL